ncbi:hypothetical protein [Lysobacter antibioticus]|uniref:hypothetical protein n=1 Tax=Lysobacter antibioticus TaxID=84531 RepID=UPI000A42DE65|nr:hypothetical protein [Lysobacter antibioticus]
MAKIKPTDSVFINCPFDPEYWPLFEVAIFTVIACGFVPRSSLEEKDSGANRLEKIVRLISSSRYGIHDLSRIQLDSDGYPRFNMPFEFGIDWTFRHYGEDKHRKKRLLLLEKNQHTLKRYLSDIAGQDPVHHGDSLEVLLKVIRDFLVASSQRQNVPGHLAIGQQFSLFTGSLPDICADAGLDRNDLLYTDYVLIARTWLTENTR